MALTDFFTSWINPLPQDWNWLGNMILRFEHCFGCQPNRIILNSVTYISIIRSDTLMNEIESVDEFKKCLLSCGLNETVNHIWIKKKLPRLFVEESFDSVVNALSISVKHLNIGLVSNYLQLWEIAEMPRVRRVLVNSDTLSLILDSVKKKNPDHLKILDKLHLSVSIPLGDELVFVF